MAAYVIFDIEVTNPEGYAHYRPLAAASLAQYGGEFLVRGGEITPLEGDWPAKRIVVVRFESAEQARKWYDSPEYTAAREVRQQNSTGRGLLVEGV